MRKKEDYNMAFYLIAGISMLLLVYYLIKPVFSALAGGILLAYLFYPFYKLINRKEKHPNLAAFATTVVIILLILVPMGFIVGSIAQKEAKSLVEFAKELSVPHTECSAQDSLKCKVIQWGTFVSEKIELNSYIKNFLLQLAQKAGQFTSNLLAGLPWQFLMLFVVFFSTFIFLRDGQKIFEKYQHLIPMKKAHKDYFIKKFKAVSFGVVYGTIMVALAQAFLATIGFWIFGVGAPLFWGLCVFVISILPGIAPPLVYLPISAFKIIQGLATGTPTNVINGILLTVWGLFIVGLVDNIIRWKVTSSKSKVHPLIVLVGILGGIKLFGIVGLFLGPLILVFALTYLEIYHKE